MFVERQQPGQGRRGTIINIGLKDEVKIQGQENYLNLTISPPVNYLALTISPPTTVYRLLYDV
jgi:hypothetical protein